MNEDEIKQKLTDEEYHILREKGTEAPFTGASLKEKRAGMYSCKVCGQQLFASDAKFDSGTGWPSFDEALPGTVNLIHDTSHGVNRTEVVCTKCGSHLGHIFEDLPSQSYGEASGPMRADGKVATKRYCINSACLGFEEKP